jgi:PTH1 family peptidyl-tRNA hydrolase
MKAVVGLGNPDLKYRFTRHNVGFMLVDALAGELDISLTDSPKMFSKVGKSQDWLLAKPQTYMNDSGRAVRAIVDFYKLSLSELYIAHDDLDITLGDYKIQHGRGPQDHNGLLSIYEALGSKDFHHIRIGTEARQDDRRNISGKDYVLTPFTDDEADQLPNVFGQVTKDLLP